MKRLALMASTFVFSSWSYAAVSTTAASAWQSVQEVDEYLQTGVCRAFTAKSDAREAVELSLSFPSDSKTLPMIRVKTSLPASLLVIELSDGTFESLFPLATVAADGSHFFWYAPVHFAKLQNAIEQGSNLSLVLDPLGQALRVQVSLMGSTAALTTCLKGYAAPSAFLQALNGQKDNLSPNLGDRSADFLFQTTQAAYKDYLDGLTAQQALAQIQKPYAALLQKDAAAKKVVDADQKSLSKAQGTLDGTNSEIASLTAQLNQDTSDLATLQQQKPAADADLHQKQAIYQPLLLQMKPLNAALQSATAATVKAQNALARKQNQIPADQSRIDADQAELSQLNGQIPQLREVVADARDNRDRAEAAYNNFDFQGDYQHILFLDEQYQSDKLSAQQDQVNLDAAQAKVQDDQHHVDQAQRQYEQCLQQHNQDVNQCGNEQSQINQASSQLNSDQSSLSDAQSRLSSVQGDMTQHEQNARSQVANDQAALRAKADQAGSDYAADFNSLTQALSRVAVIPGEISNLQADMASAQAAIPGLQQNVATAQTQQDTAQSNYDQFAKQIGFDVALKNLTDAQKVDQDIVSGIATKSHEIPQLQAHIKKDQGLTSGQQKAVASAQKNLDGAQAKLAPLDDQLKPYFDQAAPIQAALDQANQDFAVQRATFQDLDQILGGN